MLADSAAVKIAVLVSGGGTNLQALLDAQEAGKLPHGEIALVVADNADAYALTRARRHGVEALVAERAHFPDRAAFEGHLLQLLGERGIELIVLAGFMRILSADFVRAYPERILNVHPSLIPAFCGQGFYGLRVHEAALAAGVKVTGATVHLVNEVPDGGRILLQKAVPVRRGDTAQTLQQRVMEQAEWKLLPRACAQITDAMIRKRRRG